MNSRSSGTQRLVVAVALLAVLMFELVALTLPFDADALPRQPGLAAQLLLAVQHSLRPIFATTVAITLLMSWGTLATELHRVIDEDGSAGLISWRWLGVHLVAVSALAASTLMRRSGPASSTSRWQLGLLFWAAVAVTALLSWCCTILPPRFWARWIRQSRTALATGLAVGSAGFALGSSITGLWQPLQQATFAMVVGLLRLVGRQVAVDAGGFTLTYRDFAVTVGPSCSGIEGVGLVIVVVSAYLWYARRDLRFPRALLLLPIGVVAVWLLNVVRIALLVLIGNWSSDAAIKGFHSVAGWLLFNAVACGLIAVTSRRGFFSRAQAYESAPNPAAAYLLPMVVLMIGATSAHAFAASPAADRIYLSGLSAALAVMLCYWREWNVILRNWRPSILPVAVGVAVAMLWLGMEHGAALSQTLLAPDAIVTSARAPHAVLALLLGAVIVPLVEALALRGYLSRRLVAIDFETVLYSRFTWLSAAVATLTFGLLNGATLPAIVAGAVFTWLTCQRGLLADAVVAHLTSAVILILGVFLLHP